MRIRNKERSSRDYHNMDSEKIVKWESMPPVNMLSESADNQEYICPNCAAVDMHTFLHDKSIAITHSTLAEAANNINCAFCRYVGRISKTFYGSLDKDNQDMTVCNLSRSSLRAAQYRMRNEAYKPQVQLLIRLTHRCPRIPCEGDSCSMNFNRIQTWAVVLDLLNISQSIFSSSDPPTVVRRCLDPVVLPEKLIGWLRVDHCNNSRRISSANNDMTTLDSLIHVRRFRVLDVISCQIIAVRSPVRYIALSYVWGHVKPYTSEGSPTIDIQRLPWTLQDAVELVRQFGERYLWIDSLCIVQNDPIDKAALVPQMGAIYRNAYLTIVAADGSDVNARLSRLVGERVPEEWMTMITRQGSFQVSRSRPSLDDAISKCTWFTRGWTFQERLLSKRCLFFTPDGVFFDSETVLASESYELLPNAKPSATFDRYTFNSERSFILDAFEFFQPRLSGEGPLNTYISAVEEYTSRRFSYPGDRLDAFSGILRQLQPQITSSDHMDAISGLLYEDFFASLLWYSSSVWWAGRKRLPKLARVQLDVRGTRHLPRWSWAGWEGRLTLDRVRFEGPFDVDISTIDLANIVCHTPFSPPDFQYELCKVTVPLQVTLHLWIKVWPCILVPKTGIENDIVYNVEPQPSKGEFQRHEDDESDITLPDEVDASSNFELLCLDDRDLNYIVVREVNSFYERVGLVYLPSLYLLSHQTAAKYIKLR